MSLYNRERKLRESLHLHEFKRESTELEDWIAQQTQTACSNDLGSDYESVLVRLVADHISKDISFTYLLLYPVYFIWFSNFFVVRPLLCGLLCFVAPSIETYCKILYIEL